MTRLMFPALLLASPTHAHSGTHFHAHGWHYAGLIVGLTVVAALIAKRSK